MPCDMKHYYPSANTFYLFLIPFLILLEGVNYEELDAKDPETLTEEEKVALLGRPKLGDFIKIQIRIRESKEFKVSISKKRIICN